MPDDLLEVKNLSMRFQAGHRSLVSLVRRRPPDVVHAVDDVSLALQQGKAYGLVGESGCGKSTLARCVAGLYEPTAGEIRLAGSGLTRRRSVRERQRIQIVFQDPYSSLNPRMTVKGMLAEVLRVHRVVERRGVDARCTELLDLVGLAARTRDAYPHQLSGGQRQRVGIARALALRPDVLVADEPVSALDVSVQAGILKLLAELRRELGLTLLLIAHNLAVVRHVCDEVAVMYLGRVVESAATEELFTNPRHPYTRALLRAAPRLGPKPAGAGQAVEGDPPSPLNLPIGCRFNPRCPQRQPICAETEPALTGPEAGLEHAAACHFAWESVPDTPGER